MRRRWLRGGQRGQRGQRQGCAREHGECCVSQAGRVSARAVQASSKQRSSQLQASSKPVLGEVSQLLHSATVCHIRSHFYFVIRNLVWVAPQNPPAHGDSPSSQEWPVWLFQGLRGSPIFIAVIHKIEVKPVTVHMVAIDIYIIKALPRCQ